MHYYNYRFHLLDDAQLLEPKQTKVRFEHILHEIKELELIRVASDLTSPHKSISLLSYSNDAAAVQKKVTQLLLAEGITIDEMMEMETLCVEVEEEMEHVGHDHSSHQLHTNQTLKHKKKKKHSHEKHSHEKHSHEKHSHEKHSHEKHHHDEDSHHSHDEHSHENHWLKAALGLVWGVGLLVLSIASFNIPVIAYYIITGLTTLMTFYLGYNVYLSAWNALLKDKWNTSTLYAISTLTIVTVSLVSLFVPGLPMMFEAAPLVLGFWHLGEGIEHTLVDEINNNLDVRDCVPELVHLKGNPSKKVLSQTLIPNDIIIVKKGNVIPVDGVLTQKALVYTTRVDGSPYLKELKPGDTVKAGMRLADHVPSLEMRVTKTYQNSYLSLIAQNISQANKEKAPVEVFANTVLDHFIPGLLTIALISGIVIGVVFTPALAIQCVVSVLVSACPCALSLITPTAVKIGMKKASEEGVHFKNGKALQAAADVDTIVFDLNGTLTQGQLEVNALHIAEEDKKFLPHIALLEGESDHPVAKIIKSHVEMQGIVANEPLEITAIDKSHHSGIKALINNERFMVGNKDMLQANGVTIKEPYDNPENGSVYIVHGSSVIGQITLFDPVRKDAKATIEQLKRQGKEVHLCTGADRATAEKYAILLGIPTKNICANTVGAVTKKGEVSKTSYIEQLRREGRKVAMVGDAANDVTAIAYADVGVAVRSNIGDDITEQHAGIVVLSLFPIATAFDVAEKTKSNIFQNLFVSLTYNSLVTLVAAGLFVALGFALNPALGVALMVLESTIVLANLYRFAQQEVVSATSQAKSELQTEEAPGNTTSKILDALGHSPQSEEGLDPTSESHTVEAKVVHLFAHKDNIVSHTPTVPAQERVCRFC